jgi:hypothetical protein
MERGLQRRWFLPECWREVSHERNLWTIDTTSGPRRSSLSRRCILRCATGRATAGRLEEAEVPVIDALFCLFRGLGTARVCRWDRSSGHESGQRQRRRNPDLRYRAHTPRRTLPRANSRARKVRGLRVLSSCSRRFCNPRRYVKPATCQRMRGIINADGRHRKSEAVPVKLRQTAVPDGFESWSTDRSATIAPTTL